MAGLTEAEMLQMAQKLDMAAEEGIKMVGGPQALSAALRCLVDRLDPLLTSYKNAMVYAEDHGTTPVLPLTQEVQDEHTLIAIAIGLICALMMKDALSLGEFDKDGWPRDMEPGAKPN